jgi:putative DNA primase/helicase
LDELAGVAMQWTVKAEGCYVTLNPVNPALLARAGNRVIKRPKHTTSDTDVHKRIGLVFDADPVRPAGVSATDEEKALAQELIGQVVAYLTSRGWPAPILADSGNGHHARYKLDLPAADGGLVERVLKIAAARFSNDRVKIDSSLFNPARIIKLYGTMARKGDHLQDRPHRWSRVLSAPANFDCVPLVLLQELAAEVDMPSAPEAVRPNPTGNGRPWNVTVGTGAVPETRARAYVFAPGFPDSIAGQKGHNRLYHVSCVLVDGFGLGFDQALPILQDWNRDKAQPPETDKQVRHKLESAIAKHPVPSLALLNASCNGAPGGTAATAPPAATGPPAFRGPPHPLTVELLPVRPLDPAMLPEAFRAWLADSAERMSVPLDYSAAAAVVATAAVVGRRICVRPKQHDDWLVCPNLWGAVIGPPSVLKSASVDEALRPLHWLATEATKQHAQALTKFGEDVLVTQAKAGAAKAAMKKAASKKGTSDAELRRLAKDAAQADGMKPPASKRYVVNDATVEKLGEILAENPHGLLLFRDELTGFLRSLDRQGHENDRGFYLEAWSGFGSYAYDRIGRGTIIIPNVCVSIFGGIQPGPLARYLLTALSGDDADGFTPRFQVLVYPDPPSSWVNVDRQPDTAARNRAHSMFQALDSINPASICAAMDAQRGMPYLGFSTDAQELFDEWRGKLENRLRSGCDSSMIQNHLGKYRSLMPTLALLFHLVEVVTCRASPGPIAKTPALAAAAWCEYLEAHARRIYQSALDGDLEAATRLAERIKTSLPNPFRARDVVRKGWAGFDRTEAVESALLILEDRGWVKQAESPTSATGGRPTVDYWINPALLAHTQANGGTP